MPFFFFAIPARDESLAREELNGVLRQHKVLSVERRFVEAGENSFWAVRVECLAARSTGAGSGAGASAERAGTGSGFSPFSKDNRVDYRAVLSDEQFPVFTELRSLRARIAAEEGVKLFVIFTNRQLADMVINQASSKADLAKISGVGEAKVEKYGQRFLDELKRLGRTNATNGTPF